MQLTLGDVVADLDARQLRRGREAVHVTPKAFELLEILIAERPRAVRKQELYDRLWPDTFVVEANLPVLVAELRAALGDTSHTIIRTAHRYGYALSAPPAGAPFHILIHGEERFRLTPGENVAGRDPAAAIFIPSASVSRRHAVIHLAGDTATLTDLDSKNGTWLDGRRLAAPAQLTDGAAIRFGGVEMIYRRCETAEETATFTTS